MSADDTTPTEPNDAEPDTAVGPTADWALPPRTNEPYDAPSAEDLIEVVRRYLAEDLMPRSTGADRWVLRIAANALAIAGREVACGDDHRALHAARLAAFGVTTDAELSALIRSGALDDRWAAVKEAIAATVDDKLDVASPDHRVRCVLAASNPEGAEPPSTGAGLVQPVDT